MVGKAIAAINAITPVEIDISPNSIPKNSGMLEQETLSITIGRALPVIQ